MVVCAVSLMGSQINSKLFLRSIWTKHCAAFAFYASQAMCMKGACLLFIHSVILGFAWQCSGCYDDGPLVWVFFVLLMAANVNIAGNPVTHRSHKKCTTLQWRLYEYSSPSIVASIVSQMPTWEIRSCASPAIRIVLHGTNTHAHTQYWSYSLCEDCPLTIISTYNY